MTRARADAAHRNLVEADRLLRRAHSKITVAMDAYPDDTGKALSFGVALGKLSEAQQWVKGIDVSARSWVEERS